MFEIAADGPALFCEIFDGAWREEMLSALQRKDIGLLFSLLCPNVTKSNVRNEGLISSHCLKVTTEKAKSGHPATMS